VDIQVKFQHIAETDQAFDNSGESAGSALNVLGHIQGEFESAFVGQCGEAMYRLLSARMWQLSGLQKYYYELGELLGRVSADMLVADQRLKAKVR
jgi:hypothetical protein